MKRTIALLFLVTFATSTWAVVTEPGVPDAKYLVSGSVFPALANLPYEGHGTLIAKRWVVTAAHATRMMRMMGKNAFYVTIAGKRRTVERIVLYPGYAKESAGLRKIAEDPTPGNAKLLAHKLRAVHDIALIELAKPVADVKPVALYTGTDENGQVVELLGQGATGNGKVGQYSKSPHRGKLRRAYNRISATHEQWLDYTFDCGKGALPLEGVLGDGDSGGPVLIQSGGEWKLAGLADWKHWPPGYKAFKAGVCGQAFSNSRVSYYAKWIHRVLANA